MNALLELKNDIEASQVTVNISYHTRARIYKCAHTHTHTHTTHTNTRAQHTHTTHTTYIHTHNTYTHTHTHTHAYKHTNKLLTFLLG